MASIRKRKSSTGVVSYTVQIRKQGSTPVAQTFKRLEDAKKWAASTETKIEEGVHFPTRQQRRHTVGDVVDRYLKEMPDIKDAPNRKRQLEWWKAKYGKVSLAQLADVLSEAKAELKKGRAAGTVNRYLAALSIAMTVARKEWKWTLTNPLSDVDRLEEPKGRVRFLSDQEREDLLDACAKSSNRNLLPLVRLALLTGARRGELSNLTWSQVDLKRKRITVHETKNGERRSLYLAKPAVEALELHGKVRHLSTDYVFPSDDGLVPAAVESAWQEAKKTAKLKNFRFHDLRHTAASYLAMNGATLMELAEVLGHKTLAMVKRYSHLSDSHVAGVVERMAEKMGG